MSNSASKTLSFVSNEFSPNKNYNISMEQVPISETSNSADLYDIFSMYSRARSGLTAFSYAPTELSYVTFTADSIKIDLDFWVWPTPSNLAYSLSINQGSITEKTVAEEIKSGNIIIPLSDNKQLDYSINVSESTAEWETPCYDEDGQLIDPPEILFNGQYIYFEKQVFGIIRADLKASGYKHTATISFPKSASGRTSIFDTVADQVSLNAITNINCSVICTYTDEDGEEQQESLELKIPSVVLDVLSECPDETSKLFPRVSSAEEASGTLTTIYYSTCTGIVIRTDRSAI